MNHIVYNYLISIGKSLTFSIFSKLTTTLCNLFRQDSDKRRNTFELFRIFPNLHSSHSPSKTHSDLKIKVNTLLN